MKNGSLVCLLLLSILPSSAVNAEEIWCFVASPAEPAGIFRSVLETESGAMSEPEMAAADVRTGFLALHPGLPILYAASSEKVEKGEPNGAVRAYDLNEKTGELTLRKTISTGDSGTTHIEVSPTGNALAVCHYGGEGTTLVPLDQSGKFEGKISRIKHQGSSVNERRQKRPHPHGVAFAKDGKYLLVADLGNDHVEVFAVSEAGELSEHSRWKAKPGAGPRHVTFHPDYDVVYSINELDSTLSVLRFDAEKGALKEIETVSTLPDNFEGNNSTAEVVVHPNGKFVYGSNRGHESTAVFQVDSDSEKLDLVQWEPTQGEHPRFVGLEPTGKIYLATNMRSDNMVSFHIEAKTGKLTPTGHTQTIGRPMCVVFVPKP